MRAIILIGTLLGALPFAVTAQTHSAAVVAVIEDLVAANQILAAEGILPGYGHVSARHPEDPNRYFLSRAIAPELVTVDDILELDLDSVIVDSSGSSSYLERFIHGEIYKLRPDVQAVVHNHSPTVISFGIGSTPLRPVFHQAAFFLDGIPIWDYRDFGTADGALVDTPGRGRGLAVALADRPVVLMRNPSMVGLWATLRNGKWHGPYELYHDETGQLVSKGEFRDGEQCGEWLEEGETVSYTPCATG